MFTLMHYATSILALTYIKLPQAPLTCSSLTYITNSLFLYPILITNFRYTKPLSSFFKSSNLALMVGFVRLRFSPRFSLSAITQKSQENSVKKKLYVHMREAKSTNNSLADPLATNDLGCKMAIIRYRMF